MKLKGFKKILKKATAMLTLTAMITLNVINVFSVSALTLNNNVKTESGSGEIVAKRGEFEKHFQNEDGTITVATYASPVHYKSANGEWIDIDNTLVENLSSKAIVQDKVYINKGNSFKVTLNEKTNSNDLASIQMDGYELSWQISDTLDTNSVVINSVDETKEFTKTELNKIYSEIIYKNAFNNADLRYNLSFQSLKEEVILHQIPTFDKIKYTIKVENLKAKLDKDSNVIFYDVDDEIKEVFRISAPFAYDASETPSYNRNIKVDLENTADGYVITNNLDMNWLKDSNTVYPVIIDPTVTSGQAQTNIEDTHVNSGSPNTNYVMSDKLILGKSSGSNRTLIKITTMPTIPSSATITDARLIANLWSGTNTWGTLSIYRLNSAWDSYTATWNNHGSISSTLLATGITPSYVSPYYKYNINVTSTVVDWYKNGMSKNWGFMLRYDNENYNDYNWLYSSDSGIASAYRPAITITYNESIPTDYPSMNWTYPLSGYNYITCGFKTSYCPSHYAMDLSGTGVSGQPLKAAAAGKVLLSKYDSSAGYWIVIETNNIDPSTGKKLRIGYMHMNNLSSYSAGQLVAKGATIGYVGNTGDSTGAHLHFEVIRDGSSYATYGKVNSGVNPQKFFPGIGFSGNTSSLTY